MTTGGPKPPRALMEAIERDCTPVKPMRSPWQRALVVAVWCVGIMLAAPWMPMPWMPHHEGMRGDHDVLGSIMLWGPAVFQLLVGLGLVHLALREAVPGLGLPRRVLVAAVTVAILIQLGVAYATWSVSPGPAYEAGHFWAGTVCARSEALLGFPALVLTIVLALRAYPVRPDRAGLLGGLGAGLFADGIQHLKCAMSDPRHVIVWHLGGMLGLALLGWIAGHVIGALRARRA